MGGQSPLVGARVYMFTASTTGYGNASSSMLTSATGTQDSSGGPTTGDWYVTSGAGGAFSISGDYTCTANAPVYLYSVGGNSGSGANSAAGLLAAGTCPSAGNLPSSLFIIVNEVSTIAAAYAFAGFATDALHVSSPGTTLAQIGISNAFSNAANLDNISTGVAPATMPGGNGTVPQTTINSLANILASCVNSTGPGSTACSTLFADARSGGSTGTAPTETATAAINMAHNPAANITALYALSTATPPFAPALTAQPNDFTIGLTLYGSGPNGGGLAGSQGIAIDGLGDAWVANRYSYNGNGVFAVTEISSVGAFLSGDIGYTDSTLNQCYGIAIDQTGNVWITNLVSAPTVNSGAGSVTEMSSSGTILSGATGYTSGGMNTPEGIAIGASGNAFIANSAFSGVIKLSPSGVALSGGLGGYGGGGISNPGGIAIDTTGHVWVANQGGPSVTELSASSGAIVSGPNGYTANGLDASAGIAMDGSGDAWVADFTSANVGELSSLGAVLSGGGGFSGGGINFPSDVAIDGAGNAWVVNYNNSLTEISSAGAILSGTKGYTSGGLNTPTSVAVDGSGNVWAANYFYTVSEIIGVATPVVTPISVGVKNSTLGTRP
jgi:hypothetical protein